MTATTTATTATRTSTDAQLPLLALSEVALAAVTLAGVIGLRRAFVGAEWFWPLAGQALAAHALSAVLRRRGVSTPLSLLAVGAAGAVAICWVYAGSTTVFGLPTGDTVGALVDAIDVATTSFSEVKAPTDALDGFLIGTAAAIWIGAAVADWAAFRVDATIEATLPSASLFVISAIFGADIDRVLLSALWLGAVLLLVLFRRTERLGRTATWVGDRRRIGPQTQVAVGAVLVGLAVVVGAITGGRLPGSGGDGVVDILNIGDDGPGTRVTVSPLVDIRSRLVEQADVEVFTVRSDVRSYWRLTSLERFDGRIWSSNGSYGSADGDLEDGVSVASQRITFEQSYSISALDQIWMPAAYEPVEVTSTTDTRYDEVSATLIVDTDIDSSNRVDYQVTSALPQHDPVALAAASEEIPDDIADVYLDLPADLPPEVAGVARQVTQGAASDYDRAKALQDWFRSEFTYDLGVRIGHSSQAMADFLGERRGYCQQFAGTFAAMARSLGIPARVAVGFTPGDQDPSDPSLYRVRGKYAHAWPEVYLGEYGWVLFEPTPGRGAPLAENHTGVVEQQVSAGGAPGDVETPETPATAPQPTPGTAPTLPTPELDEPTLTPGAGDQDEGESAVVRWLRRIGVATAVAVLVGLAYLGIVLAVTRWRRHRRTTAAVEPPDKVALAWDEVLGAASRAGISVRASQTPQEVATRVGAHLPEFEGPVRTLALTVQDSTFAPIAPSAELAEQALALAREIEAAADASMTPRDRFLARFHPRRLLGR